MEKQQSTSEYLLDYLKELDEASVANMKPEDVEIVEAARQIVGWSIDIPLPHQAVEMVRCFRGTRRDLEGRLDDWRKA